MSPADAAAETPFVSTRRLPGRALAQRLIDEAHERFRTNTEGMTSGIYPALTRVPGDLFGISVAGVGGSVFSAGDADTGLTIMRSPSRSSMRSSAGSWAARSCER